MGADKEERAHTHHKEASYRYQTLPVVGLVVARGVLSWRFGTFVLIHNLKPRDTHPSLLSYAFELFPDVI